MMTPSQEVNIWTYDGTLKPIKYITLAAWSIALKSELKGYQVTATEIEPLARKFLGCPDDYAAEMISEHLTGSLESVKEQLESDYE